MNIAAWMLWAVAGWCGIGLVGTVISLAGGHRQEAAKHAAWLAAVGGAYLLILLIVSVTQKQHVVAVGQDQCFESMCFRVIGIDEVASLVAGSTDRVVRVRIAVTNHGHSSSEQPSIRAYLIDLRGNEWGELPGLSGNRLNSHVAAGDQIVSQPMFRVPRDASGLGLVLTHGSWQPRRLMIGDSDSFAHRPTIVSLGR